MNITINHVTLLLQAKHGINLDKARELDQRTLGSACSNTNSRPRTIDFNAKISKFVLTDTGQYILSHSIERKGMNHERLSMGVSKIVNRRGIRETRRA